MADEMKSTKPKIRSRDELKEERPFQIEDLKKAIAEADQGKFASDAELSVVLRKSEIAKPQA